MISIEAPYPLGQSTIELPNPLLGNSRSVVAKLNLKTAAMNGTMYTYVTRKIFTLVDSSEVFEEVYDYSFVLQRNKSVELLEFIRQYSGNKWKISLLDTETNDFIIGNLVTNPVSAKTVRRADCGGDNKGLVDLNFSFRGVPSGQR